MDERKMAQIFVEDCSSGELITIKGEAEALCHFGNELLNYMYDSREYHIDNARYSTADYILECIHNISKQLEFIKSEINYLGRYE